MTLLLLLRSVAGAPAPAPSGGMKGIDVWTNKPRRVKKKRIEPRSILITNPELYYPLPYKKPERELTEEELKVLLEYWEILFGEED